MFPIRHYLVPIQKRSFCPISALCSKFYPRNINYMPVVKFFAGLDLEQKSSFLDGHYLYSHDKIESRANFKTSHFAQSLRQAQVLNR